MSANCKYPHIAVWILVGSLVLSGCGILGSGQSDSRIYAGAGVLASQLEPDASGVEGVSVDDTDSRGVGLLLGYGVNERLSIEGHIADLGEATFSPDGSIAYQVGGVSGIVYGFAKSQDRLYRKGLSVFGRLGLGALNNNANGIRFKRVNDVHLLAGVGLEYGFNKAVAARLEFVRHETDASYAQFGVLYRLGTERALSGTSSITTPADRNDIDTDEDLEFEVTFGAGQEPVDSENSVAEIISDPVPKPDDIDSPSAGMVEENLLAEDTSMHAGELAQGDKDLDGVRNEIDACPETGAGLPVDSTGCDFFNGVIEGIHFQVGSAELTEGAIIVLAEILRVLLEYPEINITIEAHTDNSGDAEQNLQLSRRRALAVVRFLVDNGISGLRLRPQAFGESRPRVTNNSPDGRAANRRVEFSVFM
ncbi:MAG: OmpA family protein [Granulosicoccus sp.]